MQGLLPAGQVRDVVRHAVELLADALMLLSLSGHPRPGDGFEQAFQVCHSFPRQVHLLALGVHALPKVLSLGVSARMLRNAAPIAARMATPAPMTVHAVASKTTRPAGARKLAAAGIEMPHWRDAVARYARLRG